MLSKLFTSVIIIFIICWSFQDQRPTFKKEKEITNDASFSMERALLHVKNISYKPHYTGSKDHKRVQEYLVEELKKIGLDPQVQTQTVFNKKWIVGTTVENIVATIKGTTNNKSLLVLTHYDSNPHSAIGAADAGSGVATILEGIRAFLKNPKKPKNDIVILFSDAEELGLLGAEAFVKHHPLAKDIGLVLNFEARGSGGPSYMLMETNGKNSKLLSEFMKASPKYPTANSLMYSIYKMLPNDTDLTVFREQGNINGFNFAFIGDHFDYHTVQDTYERLDRASLLHQADYLMSTLNYFSNSNLNTLESSEDYVFVNFPFIKLLQYPFSWVGYLLGIITVLFVILFFYGLKKEKITRQGILKGFASFFIAFFLCGLTSLVLWNVLLFVHPQYQDMLHGFTYNGYEYIIAFVFLNIWILINVYNRFKNEKTTDLLIAPIIIWLVINFLIYKYLQGAGFYIIPLYMVFFMMVIQFSGVVKERKYPLLFVALSIPMLYIFAPLVKMLPVGLGLKNLYISAILIVLIFSFLLPVFHQQKKKILSQKLFGLLTIIFFCIATYHSGFSIDKKKPNSLVYIQNEDTKDAYWGTYNTGFDSYTKQIFKEGYVKGGIESAETKSKYNSRFKYHKKTPYKAIAPGILTISMDTLIVDKRYVEFTLTPQRNVNKYEFFNNESIHITSLMANGVTLYTDEIIDEKTLLVYHMANTDETLKLTLICDEGATLKITLNEISYDLLTNSTFSLNPRSDIMMPMPFVTNDAIISTRKLEL